MVRKVSILCMVASLLFSLEAATPLVTQYIAPVDNPSWDNAVTNTAYGKDAGYVFTKIEQDGYRNYVTKVKGVYMVAWNKWVEFSNTTWLQSYQRSVCHPAVSPFYTVQEYTVPEKRYLYPVTGENVSGGGVKWTVNDKITITGYSGITYFPYEAIVRDEALDSSSDGAAYVQCVHTDWVYTVTFDANGGGGSMCEFVFTNSAALPANAFSRTGYDFSKWNTWNDGLGASYADEAEVQTDLNPLYAIWSAKSYNITFSGEGATTAGKRSCTVKYDESLSNMLQSDLPKRTGYEFGGYFSEPEGKGKQWYSSTGDAAKDPWNVDSDTTLYAKWTGVQYYVSYVKGADDVTGSMDRQAFIYGEPQALLVNKYEREGYTFIGWSTHENASVAYADCEVVSNLATEVNADIVLYAVWEKIKPPETVAVVFDANGGVFDAEAATYERNIILGGRFESLPMPTNANNSLFFAGWWTSTNPVDRVQILSTNIVDAAITNLYARWKAVVSADMCTLTFILADGKISTNVTAIVGDEFGRWFFDPTPQYTGGYRHFGWYRADGSRVEETDIIEGDETLTGRWTLGAFNKAWNCSSVQFETDGDNVSGWTMDETNKVARSGDVTGLAEEYASSRLTMTPAVSGTLSIKLKTSCLPKHPDFSWLACLYINSKSDCIGGPESCRDVSIPLDGGATFYLNYYQYGGAHSYYDSVDYTVEDCAWASDFSFVPDAAECPLPKWKALADKTLSAKTGGSAQWVVVADDGDSLVITNLPDARSACVITNLPNARSGWVALETSKNRAGVLEFKWRTSCEGGYVDTNGVYQVCDRLEFQDERGERTLRIEGVMSGWESVVWTNSVESAHTFTWRYVKDGDTSAGDDAAWIKDVKWTPYPLEPKPFRVLIW